MARKPIQKSCRTCRSVKEYDSSGDHGFCRRFPPQVTDANNSSFPPVHLDNTYCDEWRQKAK